MDSRIFFISAVIGISLLGCSRSDTTKTSAIDHSLPTYDAYLPLGRELNAAPLSCGSSECLSNLSDFESIGLVGIVSSGKATDYVYNLSQCTGFLFGSNDIVALNSHCITKNVLSNRNNCRDVLGVKFAATPGHPSEVRVCEELIYQSNLDGETALNPLADYAFFRIKPVNRKPLPLSTQTVANNERISMRKISPLSSAGSNGFGGYLGYSYCQTQMESLLNASYSHPYADTALGIPIAGKTGECKIIQGNSGSPVLNARNEIIGIMQAYLKPAFLDTIRSSSLNESLSEIYKIKFKSVFPSSLSDHVVFSQTLCMKTPKNINQHNSFCKVEHQKLAELPKNSVTIFANDSHDIEKYIQTLRLNVNTDYTDIFQYALTKKTDRFIYSINPSCMLNSSLWVTGKYRVLATNSKSKQIMTESRPISAELTVTIKFNENLTIETSQLGHEFKYGLFLADIGPKSTNAYSIRSASGSKELIGLIPPCP